MRKGLSPLIAVVLLIAFTITIAAMIAAFSRTFVSEQTEQFEQEASGTAARCQFSGITARSASYDSTAGTVTVLVVNRGSENLTDFRMNIFYSTTNFTSAVPDGSNTTIARGDLLSLSSSGVAEAPHSVEVLSNQCPLEAIDRCIYRSGGFEC